MGAQMNGHLGSDCGCCVIWRKRREENAGGISTLVNFQIGLPPNKGSGQVHSTVGYCDWLPSFFLLFPFRSWVKSKPTHFTHEN